MDRTTMIKEFIIDLLYGTEHLGCEIGVLENCEETQIEELDEEKAKTQPSHHAQTQGTRATQLTELNDGQYQNQDQVGRKRDGENPKELSFDRGGDPGGDPSDHSGPSDKESESGDENKNPRQNPHRIRKDSSVHHGSNTKKGWYERENYTGKYDSDQEEKGLRMNGRDLLKVFTGYGSNGGSYDESFEETLDVYNELADMCEVTPKQKRRAMAIILKGSARAFFRNMGRKCTLTKKPLIFCVAGTIQARSNTGC